MPRLLFLAALVPFAAAADDAPRLQSGLWAIETLPGVATLDGRKLAALPYSPPPAEKVCIGDAEAADPGKWFARDLPSDCTVKQAGVTASGAHLSATCPPNTPGFPDGTFEMTGSWSPTQYRLTFTTTAHGENGAMGFTSVTTGRRLGACPAG